VFFYAIGKAIVYIGGGLTVGWLIVTASEAIKDSMTILSAKAKAIREGKGDK